METFISITAVSQIKNIPWVCPFSVSSGLIFCFFFKSFSYRDVRCQQCHAYNIITCKSSVSQSSLQLRCRAREVQAVRYGFTLLHNVALEMRCLHHFAFVAPPSLYCVRVWGWPHSKCCLDFQQCEHWNRNKESPPENQWLDSSFFFFFQSEGAQAIIVITAKFCHLNI